MWPRKNLSSTQTRNLKSPFLNLNSSFLPLMLLIGNLYFLMVFGDNTEDILGKCNYLLLIAIATIIENIVHILGEPASTVPCIGASGGISGILAYYWLRFSKAKVGIILFFRWIRIPVGFMLVIWIIFQVLGAYRQITDLSNVSALAHLGGASIGILFWWKTRQSFWKNYHPITQGLKISAELRIYPFTLPPVRQWI